MLTSLETRGAAAYWSVGHNHATMPGSFSKGDALVDGFVLEIPEMVGIPLSPARKAQAATSPWPEGTIIVSADCHMLETDCWIDRFPEHLKDQAPRMEF